MKRIIYFILLVFILSSCSYSYEHNISNQTTPSAATNYLNNHTTEEIFSDFLKATFVSSGFSSVDEISMNELFRTAILFDETCGSRWYDPNTMLYRIPVCDIQALLNEQFENCIFDPSALNLYAKYDSHNNILLAEAIGFSTGNSQFSFGDAYKIEADMVSVILFDAANHIKVTITAKIAGDNVFFLKCIYEQQ